MSDKYGYSNEYLKTVRPIVADELKVLEKLIIEQHNRGYKDSSDELEIKIEKVEVDIISTLVASKKIHHDVDAYDIAEALIFDLADLVEKKALMASGNAASLHSSKYYTSSDELNANKGINFDEGTITIPDGEEIKLSKPRSEIEKNPKVRSLSKYKKELSKRQPDDGHCR